MTDTRFDWGDPNVQTVWAPDMFEYALQLMRLSPLMGKTGNHIIHVNKDLTRQQGGDVVFRSRDPMTGAGQGDGGTTLNNEQPLQYRNMTIRVHTRMTAARLEGMLAAQITHLTLNGFRSEAKEELGTWWAEIIEKDLVNTMCGLYNENASSADIQTINEAYPTSTRILYLGQSVGASPALDNSGTSYADDATLSAATVTNNLFGTLVISRMVRQAKLAQPRMRPGAFMQPPASQERSVSFPYQGKMIGDFYVVLMSPYQRESVRSEIGTNAFSNMTAQCENRGGDHPMLSGGSFIWDGALCVEYDRIPYRTGANGTAVTEGFLLNAGRSATTDAVADGVSVARAALLGQQAISFAWAMLPGWWEEVYDANRPRVKTEGLYGTGRTQFNAHGTTTAGAEEAVYCADTCIVL